MTDYYDGEMEAIDIIKEVADGVDGEAAFCLGNIIKYVLRAGRKPGAQDDLKKANNYAHRLVYGEWRKYDKNQSREQEQETDSQGKDQFGNPAYFAGKTASESEIYKYGPQILT